MAETRARVVPNCGFRGVSRPQDNHFPLCSGMKLDSEQLDSGMRRPLPLFNILFYFIFFFAVLGIEPVQEGVGSVTCRGPRS